MKHNKQPNAVYKNGKRTAKTDSHCNNRMSVFGGTMTNRDPLLALLEEESRLTQTKSKGKRHVH